MDLNTSHVNVNRETESLKGLGIVNLNTSHVNVNPYISYNCIVLNVI